MPALIQAKSVEEFDKYINDNNIKLVVVHFSATWAPQCEQINEVLSTLGENESYKACCLLKVEAEDLPDVSMRYQIAAVPTCKLIRSGEVLDTVNGVNIPDLRRKIDARLAEGEYLPPKIAPVQDLNGRLKKLINSAPVMLFMKGSAAEPRCGFSRQTVQILNDQGVKFSTFDILSDEDVRQGLKKYSDWPTYPQLYANGELIGGLDIIKEMVESGEFKSAMPAQQSLDDRLKALINQQKVMLFMKGNPDQPRCGFSKTTVGILKDEGVTYGTFDILTDEEVRQGLKKLSDWPTYPQLYVNGDLIGGLDIIKELQSSGELRAALDPS